METKPHPDQAPESTAKGFYVDPQCCISCGVPQAVAPDLVGWTSDETPQCFWKKQPQTEDNLRQAFAIFDGQEVGCHRYAGLDPDIQARVGAENCDRPVSGLGFHKGTWGTLPMFSAAEAASPGIIRKLLRRLFRS